MKTEGAQALTCLSISIIHMMYNNHAALSDTDDLIIPNFFTVDHAKRLEGSISSNPPEPAFLSHLFCNDS